MKNKNQKIVPLIWDILISEKLLKCYIIQVTLVDKDLPFPQNAIHMWTCPNIPRRFSLLVESSRDNRLFLIKRRPSAIELGEKYGLKAIILQLLHNLLKRCQQTLTYKNL